MSHSDENSQNKLSANHLDDPDTSFSTAGDDVPGMIATHLRQMSEQAMQAGLGRSSSLIEVAALMIELEDAAGIQLDVDA